jgi:hypothetical protein
MLKKTEKKKENERRGHTIAWRRKEDKRSS